MKKSFFIVFTMGFIVGLSFISPQNSKAQSTVGCENLGKDKCGCTNYLCPSGCVVYVCPDPNGGSIPEVDQTCP